MDPEEPELACLQMESDEDVTLLNSNHRCIRVAPHRVMLKLDQGRLVTWMPAGIDV